MTVHLVDTHPCPHPRPHPQRDPHPGALAIGWLVCTGTWQTLEPHKRSEGSGGMRAKSFASNIIISKANQKENWQQFAVLRKNITNSLGEITNYKNIYRSIMKMHKIILKSMIEPHFSRSYLRCRRNLFLVQILYFFAVFQA